MELHADLAGTAGRRRYSGERTTSLKVLYAEKRLSYHPSLFSNALRISLGFLFLLDYTRRKYIFLGKTRQHPLDELLEINR